MRKFIDRINKFRCSREDNHFCGLCGGLGESTSVPAWAWRILFCLSFAVCGYTLILYILCGVFIPYGKNND